MDAYCPKKSVGSSYLIQFSPGCEMVGGVEIELKPVTSLPGSIRIEAVNWFTGQKLSYDEISLEVEAAIEGISEVAVEYDIPIHDFDIVITRIPYHPVDSAPFVFKQAGRSALKSAYEAWIRKDLVLPDSYGNQQ